VKGLVAVFMHALDAGTSLTLTANSTRKPPASRRYTMQLCYRLEKLDAAKSTLWDPQRTNYMCPSAIVRTLHSAAPDWTHTACDVVGNTCLASPTQPLALWNVRYTVAFLVNSKIAGITEQDNVDVCALVIAANCTDSIIV